MKENKEMNLLLSPSPFKKIPHHVLTFFKSLLSIQLSASSCFAVDYRTALAILGVITHSSARDALHC